MADTGEMMTVAAHAPKPSTQSALQPHDLVPPAPVQEIKPSGGLYIAL